MATVRAGTILTPEERLARRRLNLRDAVSLVTLFLITAAAHPVALSRLRSATRETRRADPCPQANRPGTAH
jgi:hypothetical protein